MKKAFIIAVLGLTLFDCFGQEVNEKYFIGASMNISYDDVNSNNFLPYNLVSTISKSYQVSGEFGWFLSQGNIIGFEISGLKQVYKRTETQNPSVLSSMKTTGISMNPKYKYLNRITDNIWFYTDFKILFQINSHKNDIYQLDYVTYEGEYLDMTGWTRNYGMGINPGIIVRIKETVGIKIDYSLFSVTHSTIFEAKNSEVDFEPINAWDYGLNMKLSGLNLGVVFTL